MSTKITGQREPEIISTIAPTSNMGVASPSTKRRLESPSEGDEIVSAKIAKKLNNNNNELLLPLTTSTTTPPEAYGQDTAANENSSDFLTTSILARTLLTSSTGTACYALTSDPLESLKSSLEALPAPAALDFSLTDTCQDFYVSFHEASDTELPTVRFHEMPASVSKIVKVLSPNDDNSLKSLSDVVGGVNGGGGSTLSSHHQVITEDENGKSYFNLGSASDATIVARKSSYTNNSTGIHNLPLRDHQNQLNLASWNHCNGSSGSGNSLNSSCGNNNDFDDNASSSSCESISSEDLFNSGEEYDASDDDEDELCSYKQQRSTVLHLSLCKLNKFRTQQCVEPSLHRSVLICNTLRQIEQEIKNESEVDESLKSREKLPSFWRSTSNHCFSNNSNLSSSSQPQITDTRPSSNNGLSTANANNVLMSSNGHDPYLSPNPYSEAPYMSYDYNSLRPTPYHTTSYEYEHDLPNSNSSVILGGSSPSSQSPGGGNQQTSLLPADIASVNATSSALLECDSGYGEDLDLSSYYYSTISSGTSHNQSQSQQQPPMSLSPTGSTSSVSLMDTSSDFMNSPSSTNPAISSPVSVSMSSASSSSSNSSGSGGNVSPPYHLQHCVVGGFSPGLSSSPVPVMSTSPPRPECEQPVSVLTPSMSHDRHQRSGSLSPPSRDSDMSDSSSSSSSNMSISSTSVGSLSIPSISVSSASLPVNCLLSGGSSPPSGPQTSPPHPSSNSSSSSSPACDYLGGSRNQHINSIPSTNGSVSTALSECQSSVDHHHQHHQQQQNQICWSKVPTTLKEASSLIPPIASSAIVAPQAPQSSLVSASASVCSAAVGVPGGPASPGSGVTFAQQDSQCGLESRRSDLSISNHFSNHNLPMENLISSTYSSSL